MVDIEAEQLHFNPEIRAREDFITWAAEALDGQMRTPTEYTFDPDRGELIAGDGSEMGRIFSNSLSDAERMVQTQPQLSFELRRRQLELQEYQDMIAIMRGDLPSTMVVVSDFPAELRDFPADVGGYNVSRKQTFLRVIQKNGDNLKMYSQTLDGSDRKGLEAIYSAMGCEAEAGELLGQRIYSLSEEDAKSLTNRLVTTYDNTLRRLTGQMHVAGRPIRRQEQAGINTHDFVRSQRDVIALAIAQSRDGVFEEHRYDAIALLSARFEQAKKEGRVETVSVADSVEGFTLQMAALQQQQLQEGQLARSERKVFSGCGITAEQERLDRERTAEEEYGDNGYGNQTDTEESYSFSKRMFCVSCQAPPGEEEKQKMCGPCGLCRDCDKKFGGKG